MSNTSPLSTGLFLSLAAFLSAACADGVKPTAEDTSTSSLALDGDGDGYSTEDNDCDDSNEGISPGAEEICDGVDNNCDGSVDEGVTDLFYADTDGDGFGADDI